MCKILKSHRPIKRQKYIINSLISTKYFNQNQKYIIIKQLGDIQEVLYDFCRLSTRKLLTSAKNVPL